MNIQEQASFIWSIADLLRGNFKQSEYGKVILPFTVLRRFDCVLAESKEKILEMNQTLTVSNKAPIFKRYTGHDYYNTSKFDFQKLIDDSTSIEANLHDYINGFSDNVKEIMNNFEIFSIIEKLNKSDLLYLIVQKFSEINMSDETIDNLEMGYMFEELIRKFSEQSNETAGEHFTPREVIELIVDVLFDVVKLDEMDGKIFTIFDPACGTGGMLSVAQNKMLKLNNKITVIPFGQELNPETYAICKSDMILRSNTNSSIVLGNSFNQDGFKEQTFDYIVSNPPFGVEWKKVERFIKDEAESLGFTGRFGAGTPRISDGSLLFLQHMISKMNPLDKGGSRIAIIFNGSPLFTGDAGSGESEIRRWIIEQDFLEAVIALPEQLFYNTGIFTYIWIVTNHKTERRKGKIRLVNGVSYFEKMRKSLGNKRNFISEENRKAIVNLYSMYEPHEDYIDFDNEDFGYRKIVVERPIKYNFSCDENRVNSLPTVFQTKKNCTWDWSTNEFDGKPMPQHIIDLKNDLTALGNTIYTNEEQFKELIAPVVKKYKLTAIQYRTLVYNVLNEIDENGSIYIDAKGNKLPNTSLRDTETIPLKEDIYEYFKREVLPHVPDAWIDESKTKIGYEIPFTRHFYKFKPLRSSREIMDEIKVLEKRISKTLKEVLF